MESWRFETRGSFLFFPVLSHFFDCFTKYSARRPAVLIYTIPFSSTYVPKMAQTAANSTAAAQRDDEANFSLAKFVDARFIDYETVPRNGRTALITGVTGM